MSLTSQNQLKNQIRYFDRYNQFYKDQVSLDLVLKFNYVNVHEVAKLERLDISTIANTTNKKLIIFYLIFLELISGQPGILKETKQQKYHKVNKSQCFTRLKHKNKINLFLDNLINRNLPKLRSLSLLFKSNISKTGSVNLLIKDIFIFPEIELDYQKFKDLQNSYVNINILLNTRNSKIVKYFMSLYQIPFK